MSIEVRYVSRTGHTKKIAEAIANKLNISAVDTSTPISGQADILFLGGAVYMFTIDKKLKSFIDNLDSTKVKKAVLFSTSGSLKTALTRMEKLLKAKGIPVANEKFYLSVGHGGHKDITEADIKAAEDFAASIKTSE